MGCYTARGGVCDLENRKGRQALGGSNPSPSAINL